jgi:hypothetical protein
MTSGGPRKKPRYDPKSLQGRSLTQRKEIYPKRKRFKRPIRGNPRRAKHRKTSLASHIFILLTFCRRDALAREAARLRAAFADEISSETNTDLESDNEVSSNIDEEDPEDKVDITVNWL